MSIVYKSIDMCVFESSGINFTVYIAIHVSCEVTVKFKGSLLRASFSVLDMNYGMLAQCNASLLVISLYKGVFQSLPCA